MLNTYWTTVLDEVLNKNNPNHVFLLTNAHDIACGKNPFHRRDVAPCTAPRIRRVYNARQYERYYLDAPYEYCYLTPKEAICVFYRFYGMQYIEIAKKLNVARRTVESYLQSTRHRLGCSGTVDMIAFLAEAGFFRTYELVDNKVIKRLEKTINT